MYYVDSFHLPAVKLHFFPRSHTILLHRTSSLHFTPLYDSWSRDRGKSNSDSGCRAPAPPSCALWLVWRRLYYGCEMSLP